MFIINKVKRLISKDSEGDFDDGGRINQDSTKRNARLTLAVGVVVVMIAVVLYSITRPKASVKKSEPETEFGEMIDDNFTAKDNQSALTAQQLEIEALKSSLDKALKTITRMSETFESKMKLMEEKEKTFKENLVNRIDEKLSSQQASVQSSAKITGNQTSNPQVFGQAQLPPRPTPASTKNQDVGTLSHGNKDTSPLLTQSIDSHTFHWASDKQESNKRTSDNYVPTGSFVTAVVTGGADANAGVLGQGDTSPIIFQTVNNGFLPNGKKSHLKNCTITASVYGELSSSRGITRTNRLSCIFENGDILDIPVKGTAFNFGRNGIRGTAVLRNGKIVQMAGTAGILTGLGETGSALASTTSTSALGSTSTVNGSDAALNLLGNATSSVGSKLADYYIKLAEQYHPIIELNPGNVVNIVFLEGFPLDPVEAKEYESKKQQEAEMAQGNPLLSMTPSNTAINPLAQQVQQQIQNQGNRQSSNPFGVVN